jgi:hypothetical protein
MVREHERCPVRISTGNLGKMRSGEFVIRDCGGYFWYLQVFGSVPPSPVKMQVMP